jgi:hypothetical protein
MRKTDINLMLATVMLDVIPKEWINKMPSYMMSITASDALQVYGYAQTVKLLRDLADNIEHTAMKLETQNGD